MRIPATFLAKWRGRSEAAAAGSLETGVPLTDDEVRTVWLCASWLIGYPGAELMDRLGLLGDLVARLPDPVRGDLHEVVDALAAADPVEIASEYVETFDTRRRGCLYLTYFANGDTRRRGIALLEVKEAYRRAGLDVAEDELPDHLSYVLEFGAAHDLHAAASILLAHRAGVELLRVHLTEAGSPWAGVLRAVCATLPPLDGEDVQAVMRLASEGPEEELVGLAGYGDGSADMPPADMSPYAVPGSGAAGGPVFVPLSHVKGLQP